ncbi:MAG TPA: AsmA family protein [Vicinamibacterales bacterium]|nr:AsmA family protein [Vicinamibacterales bacterium]
MRRKQIAIVAGSALLLLVIAVLAAPWLIDVNRYRGRLEAELGKRLNRQVTLGPMRLSLVPLGVRVADVAIAEDPALQTGHPFARVQELYVSPRLLPLLRGGFELRSVELREPQIELVRDSNGRWNFATIGASASPQSPQPPQSPQSPQPPQSSQSGLVLNRLVISKGQVALTDLQKPPAGASSQTAESGRSIYRNIDVQLDDFAPERAFGITVAATLPGEGAQRLSVRGKAGPLVPDAIAMTPLDGTAELDHVSIGAAQRFLETEALAGTDAVISGTASVHNQQGRVSATGSLKLDETRVRNVPIGYPISLDFDIAHASHTNVLTVNKGTFRLGDTPMALTGTVNLQPDTPVLDVHASATEASLAEAARLASAFGVAFGTQTQVQGRASADVRAKGPANTPALTGYARLRGVSVSGKDIPQPVRSDAIDLTLTPDEIRSNDFSVTSAGTALGVGFALSQYTSGKPSLDAHVRMNGADVGEVLNIARAWGVGAADGARGTGRLTVDVRANGPLDALMYNGSGSLADATLQTPSITQPLRIGKANITFSRDAASLDNLAAGIGKTNVDGRLSIRNFAAPQVDFQLGADRVDVKELQGLFAPAEASKAPKPSKDTPARSETAAATQDPQNPQNSVLTRTTGSGRLRVGSISYDQLLLENVQATATLDHGLVRLDPVTAGLFGGQHRGAITLDARRTPMTVAVASTLDGVDANRITSAVTNVKNVIFGALGSNVRMNFAGDSGDALARSLNGTLSINLTNGRIANVNLMQEVANIARFATGAPKAERSTQVAALSGTFDVQNGVARTDNVTASIEGGTLGAIGTVNLVDQSLNMRLTTVLSREYSEKIGGSRVGGYLSTVLANQQGELVVPLIVTGSTTMPRIAPDSQRIAEMKVQNLLPSLRNPGTLTSGILGAIGQGQKPAEGGAQPRKPTVGDIIGAATGKKPSSTQPPSGQQPSGQPPAETPPEAKPPQKDTGKQIEDALRDLLGRRKKPAEQKPEPPPPDQPAK